MAAYCALSLVLLAAVVSNTSGNRIVGGDPTTIEEYPTIVQLETRSNSGGTWSQNCGATILNERYVLSAAHCFDGFFFRIEDRRIRAGSSNRNIGGVVINFESKLNHPTYYESMHYDGDISIARLESPLTFTPVIQPATIIAQHHGPTPPLPDNLPVVHAGWGHTSSGGTHSPVLLDVTIYTINHDLCAKRYIEWMSNAIVSKNMICAGILDVGGKDACQGDSGGPLYYIQPTGEQLLVGVVSWGEGCADSHFPGVSISVASYTDWITANAV